MNKFRDERFAVISDIHGNADALAAVLNDISSQSITDIVNLGDHLSGPLAARETMELLLAHDIISIRGNHDRWLVQTDPNDLSPIDKIAYDQLDGNHLNWLRALPPALQLSQDVFACHGTPGSDMAYWLEHVTPDGEVVLKPKDKIERETNNLSATLFLCGHTHLPRRVDLRRDCVILNPGSVGLPGYVDESPVHHIMQTGTAAACYAVVEKGENGWVSSFRHIPYDPDRMIELAREASHPDWAGRLAFGWVS